MQRLQRRLAGLDLPARAAPTRRRGSVARCAGRRAACVGRSRSSRTAAPTTSVGGCGSVTARSVPHPRRGPRPTVSPWLSVPAPDRWRAPSSTGSWLICRGCTAAPRRTLVLAVRAPSFADAVRLVDLVAAGRRRDGPPPRDPPAAARRHVHAHENSRARVTQWDVELAHQRARGGPIGRGRGAAPAGTGRDRPGLRRRGRRPAVLGGGPALRGAAGAGRLDRAARPHRARAGAVVPADGPAPDRAGSVPPRRVRARRSGAGPGAGLLDAGGVLVSDAHAPAWWVLADPEGNELCVQLHRAAVAAPGGPRVLSTTRSPQAVVTAAVACSTQNSLPSGSASTAHGASPWPMSTRRAPRSSRRCTSAAWSASAGGARSRCSRFLPLFASGHGHEDQPRRDALERQAVRCLDGPGRDHDRLVVAFEEHLPAEHARPPGRLGPVVARVDDRRVPAQQVRLLEDRSPDDRLDLGEVAARRVAAGRGRSSCRLLLGADVLRLPAPGAEPAARRRVDRARHVAREHDPLRAAARRSGRAPAPPTAAPACTGASARS